MSEEAEVTRSNFKGRAHDCRALSAYFSMLTSSHSSNKTIPNQHRGGILFFTSSGLFVVELLQFGEASFVAVFVRNRARLQFLLELMLTLKVYLY